MAKHPLRFACLLVSARYRTSPALTRRRSCRADENPCRALHAPSSPSASALRARCERARRQVRGRLSPSASALRARCENARHQVREYSSPVASVLVAGCERARRRVRACSSPGASVLVAGYERARRRVRACSSPGARALVAGWALPKKARGAPTSWAAAILPRKGAGMTGHSCSRTAVTGPGVPSTEMDPKFFPALNKHLDKHMRPEAAPCPICGNKTWTAFERSLMGVAETTPGQFVASTGSTAPHFPIQREPRCQLEPAAARRNGCGSAVAARSRTSRPASTASVETRPFRDAGAGSSRRCPF